MATGSAMGMILIGVAMDVYGLVHEFNWNRRGYGPSGCGILSVFLYIPAVLFSRDSIFGTLFESPQLGRALGLLVMIATHICLLYVIPGLHRAWIERVK